MKKLLSLLALGLVAAGCGSTTPSPATPGGEGAGPGGGGDRPVAVDPVAPVATGEPAAPGGSAAPVTPGKGPREFAPVADRGLVTLQQLALVEPFDAATFRLGADGAWSWSGKTPASGKLDAAQLKALQALLKEAETAQPHTEASPPCDAITTQSTRVLLPGRELGWSGPCAGPPPPQAFATLARYVRQLVEGRPAAELEKTLSSR